MANKKYNEFGTVAYDATRIILTANPTTGELGKITNNDYVRGGLGYKIYTALFYQTGANVPVPIVLQNTIGNIVWSRQAAGHYEATLIGAFPFDKTIFPPFASAASDAAVMLPIWGDTPFSYAYQITWQSEDFFRLTVVNSATFLGVELSAITVAPLLVEIRVYP